MNLNPFIFRAYDIRGIAEGEKAELTSELAHAIGQATATYLIRQEDAKNMVVGRDNRLTSEELQKAFIKGVMATGLTVTDIGLATSPLLYYATAKYGFDSGANITASHNPKEYNGIKIVRHDAHCVWGDEIQEILSIIQNEDYITSPIPGSYSTKLDIFDDYVIDVRNRVQLERPLKVVVDTGNGVAGRFAPTLLREIGCEVIELFTELDGNFPNHEANPEQPKNMVDLGEAVVDHAADLGIGFDGDGDRVGIVDETGKHHGIEAMLIPLARDLLKAMPGEKVIFDVKVSQNLIKEIKRCGGQPLMNRTGHSLVEKRLHDEDAPLAGEKSGHIYMNKKYYDWFGFDDATFAAAKFLEVISKSSRSVSAHFADLPNYANIPETKAGVPDERKHAIMQEIESHFLTQYDCINIDGVRITFDEHSWGLIRSSNTSPYFTILIEADSEKRLTEIMDIFRDKLAQYPEVTLP